MKVVTANEMREIDRISIEERGIPGLLLMENAGRGVADVMERFFSDLCRSSVVVVAGRGNNGGDGFVVARHLYNRGVDVEIVLLSDPSSVKGDAQVNLGIVRNMGIAIFPITGREELGVLREKLKKPNLIIVDAIFGTGLSSPVEGIPAEAIDLINRSGARVVSVDIPSGVDASTGRIMGNAVKADLTVTFGLPKIGQLLYPGADYTGRLEIVDISIPRDVIEGYAIKQFLITEGTIARILKERQGDSHKGHFGHLFVISGSVGKTGAAALCCEGALRVGTGLVTLGIPKSLNGYMEVKLTEAMTEPLDETPEGSFSIRAFEKIKALLEKKTAIALGPGISTNQETVELVHKIIREISLPMVIDADGINALSLNREILNMRKGEIVLTPHPGEFSRLTGIQISEIKERKIDLVREFSEKYRVYLVLKGARTLIGTPDGEIFINPTGNPGMATGGMGDVLTGMIGGFIAQGYPPIEACILGVFLHGMAADLLMVEKGRIGYTASEVANAVVKTIEKIYNIKDDIKKI